MALEDLTGSNKFIANLVPANPPATDPASQGSDHIQGIKNVLKNTFPGMAGAYAFGPTAQAMTWTVGGAERLKIDVDGTISGNYQKDISANFGKLKIRAQTDASNLSTYQRASSGESIGFIGSGGGAASSFGGFFDFAVRGVLNGLILESNTFTDFYLGGAKQCAIGANGFTITNLAGTGNRPVYSDASGNLTNASSDDSLKENVEELARGLDAVMAMRPVSYSWIDKERRGDQLEIGFIAQEMRDIVPEVVGSNYDDTLSLDYAKLVAVVAKAIQELKAEVDALKAR